MPIPKPKKDETEKDYLSRCMGNPTMNEEYDDSKQRMAVCGTTWREAKGIKATVEQIKEIGSEVYGAIALMFAKEPEETFEIEAEIFAVGKWNGMEFGVEDLMDFANNFHRLKDFHKVPLKFGHNEEQPFTDGQPALGWVDDVWFNKQDGKLLGKFVEVPKIVKEAIEKGLYKHVSIEADFGVEHNGSFYSNVLSGVALLGADIPAVNTLQNLQAFMSKSDVGEYKFTKRQCFNYQKGVSNMPKTAEELQAELDAANAKFTAAEDARKKAEEASDKLKADAAKAEFSRQKSEVEAELETLVKDNKITPAQRDTLGKDITEGTIEQVRFSINVLKENNKAVEDEGDTGKGGRADNGSGYKDPIDELDKRARKFSREKKVDYKEAVHACMEDDPDLARDYLTITGS